jgi:uncharacterized protein YqjF (DUF2071 family)
MTDDQPAAFEALQGERARSAVETPRGDWIMGQRWEDLLFLSWPVPIGDLEGRVPPGVEIDTFDGAAWISVVPFWMEGARFRELPPIPFLASFPEVNVRTYVRAGDHRSVCFLSLDTQSHVNVFIARHAFHLPYFFSDVQMERGDEISFRSARPGGQAAFAVRYGPSGDEFVPSEGSLEHFLTERYSMVCSGHDETLYRGDIQHDPWRLRAARWRSDRMDLVAALGLGLESREPVAFYSASTQVVLWAPVKISVRS